MTKLRDLHPERPLLDVMWTPPGGGFHWQALDDPALLYCTDLAAPLAALFAWMASGRYRRSTRRIR